MKGQRSRWVVWVALGVGLTGMAALSGCYWDPYTGYVYPYPAPLYPYAAPPPYPYGGPPPYPYGAPPPATPMGPPPGGNAPVQQTPLPPAR
jgi:hypothetical protein